MKNSKKVDAMTLIKKFEGFSSEAYLDTANVPTIGYGNTRHLDGTRVVLGEKISKIDAEFLLMEYLNERVFFQVEVLQKTYGFCDKVFIALSSFAYNLGSILTKKSVMNAIKSNDLNMLEEAFLKYVKVKKDGVLTVSKGLVNRRKKEIEIFKEKTK